MKKIILGLAAAALTFTAGAAMAQPYGYRDHRGGYDDRYERYRDSDRDGRPDRVEWGRDRDRDGRPDQWDRYDNRRGHHWRGHRHHHHSRWSHRPHYRYDYRHYR